MTPREIADLELATIMWALHREASTIPGYKGMTLPGQIVLTPPSRPKLRVIEGGKK